MDPDKYNLITTLHELQHAIAEGDIEIIKKIINWFHENLARYKKFLSELYTSGIQCPTQTDLILAACQNKQADILYYIFNQTDILVHLTDDSFDDTEVNRQRTEAFKHALCLDAFDMIEMLYDYWCGNLHWIGHDINKIEMVGNVLRNAYVVCLDRKCLLKANYHSLIKFNEFQCKIYTQLTGLDPSGMTPKDTATMLIKVLRDYDKYSKVEQVRIQHTVEERGVTISADLTDKISRYTRKYHEYIQYEVYYRKLVFNVILLILENLSIIREHLQDRFNKKNIKTDYPKFYSRYERDAKLYKEIECAIYYFIYRTSEDWRLYLPKHRPLMKEKYHTGIQGSVIKNLEITFDLHKLYHGPVIFFERIDLKICILKLKKIFREHFIDSCPFEKKNKQIKKSNESLLDKNYLQTIRYMSDHYSLKKIVYYIQAIENTNNINVLMIERVLHVIGEMSKSTNQSYHLSRSTHALLQIAISVETISQLHKIRNFLSHADKGQLSTRIANTHVQTYAEIKQELMIIKNKIKSVLDIYKFILDKSLLEKGFRLLEQRLEGLPDEASRHIDEIHRLYKIHKKELFLESHQFNREVWRHTGLTIPLLKEIHWILENGAQIYSNIQFAKTELSKNVASILPTFIQYVRRTLQLITENNNNVNKLNQQLPNNDKMRDFPDDNEINRIQNILKKIMKTNKQAQIDVGLITKIKNYNNHWNCIKEMLVFCLNDCELFASISHLNLEANSLPNTPTVIKVYNILTELEALCIIQRSTFAWIFGKRAVDLGLRIYRLFENWMGLRLNEKHFVGIEKLHNDTDFKKRKPDVSRIARQELIALLIKRLDQLKQTMLYPNPQQIPLSRHVERFNFDVKFRVTLEMLLGDIANVLAGCKIRLMYKSSKLLREIDLGDVLDHGNPFLEVIGNVFNSHDLSAELLDKAMMFADDGKSIEALYELFKGGMDYETILSGDPLTMNDQQKVLYELFIKSPNWESYAQLTRYGNEQPKIAKTTKNC